MFCFPWRFLLFMITNVLFSLKISSFSVPWNFLEGFFLGQFIFLCSLIPSYPNFIGWFRYPKTTAWDIMLGMNLWGTIYNMIYMFGWPQGIGYEAIQFCKQHPEAAWDIFFYCLCGAVGQNFIFLTISRFGSLTNTTITTTRKFVSIVVSSLLSSNPLSPKQWGCVLMVFSGLSYQIYLKWKKLQRLQKKRKPM